MDIASVVGMFGVVTLSLWAMTIGGEPNTFFDLISVLFVFGGTFMLILSSFPFKNVTKIGSYCWYAFVPPKTGADEKKARIDLEMGILIMDRAKTYFQAMGWIGMLVGLVNMLGSLEDPAHIGPAMAVAILTVFYGIAMAYLFCLPIKTKLQFHLNKLELINTGVDDTPESKIKSDGKMKIDVSSIVGVIGAIVLIVLAIKQGGELSTFFDTTSILVVNGGTALLTLFSFPLKNYISSPGYYLYAFVYPNFEEDEKKIQSDLETGILMFDRVMTFSKSYGWVGILIGFIWLCQDLNDPSSIGPAVALIILCILYALIIAYVIFLPAKTMLECHVKNLVAQS